MEILNIGPLELIIILLLMFILLGPKEMVLTANRIGKWVRSFVRSPMWREIMGYSQEIRDLPQKIMEESGLEETLAEVRQSTQAAADELNSQLKEVTEAARIPEAEHLTLDITGQPDSPAIKPASSSAPEPVPFSSTTTEEPAAAELAPTEAEPATAEPKPAKGEKSAFVYTDLPLSQLLGADISEPAAVLPVAEAAAASAAEVEEKPASTTRRRKTKAAEPVGDQPAPTKRRRKKAEEASAEPSNETQLAVVDSAPVVAIVAVTTDTAAAPSAEEAPANVQPPAAEPPSVIDLPASAEQSGVMVYSTEPAPKPRRGRPRKTNPAVEPNEVQPQNGKVTKPAEPEDAANAAAETAPVSEAVSEATPASKPRARRSTKPDENNAPGTSSNAEQVPPPDAV